MARASLSDIKALASSVLTQNDFILNLGVVPGSGLTQSKEAVLKCTSIALPGIEVETLVVDTHGFKVVHRGIKKFGDQTFSCEFLVSGDTSLTAYNADSFNLIYNWLNFLCDTDSGAGQAGKTQFFSGLQGMSQGVTGKLFKKFVGDINPNIINNTKIAYALDDVTLDIYNTAGNLTVKVFINGVFPTALTGLEFINNQTDKQVLKIKVTFAFDSYTVADILSTKALDFANKLKDRVINKVAKKLPPGVNRAIKKYSRAL